MLVPENSHERFVRLLTEHEGIIRASIRSVIQRTEDVAEIMQSVSVVMWRKFDSLTDSTGFAKWACVIARYEILKFKRARARDRFQFDEELISLILEEGAEELPARTARLAHLEACLEKLPESRKALVLQAYAEGCTIKHLAERLGRSQDGLYQLLRRIREELRHCMEFQLGSDDSIPKANNR